MTKAVQRQEEHRHVRAEAASQLANQGNGDRDGALRRCTHPQAWPRPTCSASTSWQELLARVAAMLRHQHRSCRRDGRASRGLPRFFTAPRTRAPEDLAAPSSCKPTVHVREDTRNLDGGQVTCPLADARASLPGRRLCTSAVHIAPGRSHYKQVVVLWVDRQQILVQRQGVASVSRCTHRSAEFRMQRVMALG